MNLLFFPRLLRIILHKPPCLRILFCQFNELFRILFPILFPEIILSQRHQAFTQTLYPPGHVSPISMCGQKTYSYYDKNDTPDPFSLSSPTFSFHFIPSPISVCFIQHFKRKHREILLIFLNEFSYFSELLTGTPVLFYIAGGM